MRLIQKSEIYKQIALELDVPFSKIKKAVEGGQFKFVSLMMGTQMKQGVRLPYFGRFFPDPVRVRRLLMIKWTKAKKLKTLVDDSTEEKFMITKVDMEEMLDTILYLYERNHQLKNKVK